ncbi:MAG: hypothetical protein KBS35_01185 [Mycoplasma sp.]|nr:hypothetical protein [Candidatus Hennigella equi]
MRRFRFPFAYQPKVNLRNTIIYSSIFKQHIFAYLQSKYKCINIDPAFIVDNKKSSISYLTGDRIMSFDNKATNSIYSLNSTQDNYLLLASKLFKTENLITFAPFIKRDAKQTNLDSIINWNINIELSMPINLNINYFTVLSKELFYALGDLTSLPELKKIYKVNDKRIRGMNFHVVDAQKIESSYPTLPLKDAFNHYCSEHRFVIIQNNIKQLKSGKSLEQCIPTAQDKNLSCGLYVYDDTNNKPINLISVYKRPEGLLSKKQLNDSNPLELANELYDQGMFDKTRPTNIAVVINFTNLLFYFLEKIHLAEVVKSVWPDEFIDFVKTEKIEIF